jgi:putative membrane protein
MKKKIFIVCVDRDNDLGRKVNLTGPIIGKENNTSAALKLALTDPTESDANTMFAAIKKLDEAKKEFRNVEIVTLTGHGKIGLKSDKEINKQIENLKTKYVIDGWILVTDGMEDSQVIPILQSTAKIISTEEIIIKQAQMVESTYYTIKEALKDPGISRLFFGVPGIILVMFGALFTLGFQAFQPIALVVGLYLLIKGFGVEEKILGFFSGISTSFLEQRGSLPLYVGGIGLPLFGIIAGYSEFIAINLWDSFGFASAFRIIYPFFALGAIMIVIGKAIDTIHEKKAYHIGKYIISSISLVLLWAILDSGTLVFLRHAEIPWFLINIVTSLVILVFTIRIGKVFDIRDRVTKMLIGISIFDLDGNYLGRIDKINRRKQSIIYINEKNIEIEKTKKQFKIDNGKVIIFN